MAVAMRLLFALLVASWLVPAAEAQVVATEQGVVYTIPARTMRDIPFRTVIRQKYDYSCGSAALATLLRFHYGLDVDEAAVFQAMYAVGDQAAIRKVGFSLLDMKKYLTSIGYGADGYKLSLDELAQENVPAITVITVGSYKHFAVIKGVNGRDVLLGDPALGLRRIPRDDFAKIWTGIVFLLHAPKLATPVYNSANEWRPWTEPPLSAEVNRGSFADLNVYPPTIFQIEQFTPLGAGL